MSKGRRQCGYQSRGGVLLRFEQPQRQDVLDLPDL